MGAFDPDALECLAAVVEEGSFERAAQRQLISQSAVSQRLLGLEAQIGVALVVRSRPEADYRERLLSGREFADGASNGHGNLPEGHRSSN